MPSADPPPSSQPSSSTASCSSDSIFSSSPVQTASDFPIVTRDNILNCSYDRWFPTYRTSCIRSRIIPLTPDFVQYLGEDGILLASEDTSQDDCEVTWQVGPSKYAQQLGDVDNESDSDSDDEPAPAPPNVRFPELHLTIKDKIAELGGEVAPKLNWTAPKDATWISPHQNTMMCKTPNDVYLLLKSSNFINYDLEHAFDDCTPSSTHTSSAGEGSAFRPVLVLRSFFNIHTALEFRCFVKNRNLIGITQRDLNFYGFLTDMSAAIVAKVMQFFNHKLRYTFPDSCFVFDVYIPEGEDGPLGRARLIDINPWSRRTDSLLFDWDELVQAPTGGPSVGRMSGTGKAEPTSTSSIESNDSEMNDEEHDAVPELRLVQMNNPAAYNFSAPAYSAHKLPKDVVDASMSGDGGIREFAQMWKEMEEHRQKIAKWEEDGP